VFHTHRKLHRGRLASSADWVLVVELAPSAEEVVAVLLALSSSLQQTTERVQQLLGL
jgi:hypothetical protein